MEFLSTVETYELKRKFGNFLLLRSLTNCSRGLFSFLLKNQNRELFYKTAGDALSMTHMLKILSINALHREPSFIYVST